MGHTGVVAMMDKDPQAEARAVAEQVWHVLNCRPKECVCNLMCEGDLRPMVEIIQTAEKYQRLAALKRGKGEG